MTQHLIHNLYTLAQADDAIDRRVDLQPAQVWRDGVESPPQPLLDFNAHLLQTLLGGLVSSGFLGPTLSAAIDLTIYFTPDDPNWGRLRAFTSSVCVDPLDYPIGLLELLIEKREVAYGRGGGAGAGMRG